MFFVLDLMLSAKIALLVEIESLLLNVYLNQCSSSVTTVIAPELFMPPRRKGIPCSTVSPPSKGVPEGLRSTDKVSHMVGSAHRHRVACGNHQHCLTPLDPSLRNRFRKSLSSLFYSIVL